MHDKLSEHMFMCEYNIFIIFFSFYVFIKEKLFYFSVYLCNTSKILFTESHSCFLSGVQASKQTLSIFFSSFTWLKDK